MTRPATDPALDLTIQRTIGAPRERIWRAWTEPDLLQQWWAPAPSVARVDLLELRSDGTDYRAIVRHGDPAARSRHEELGFFEGWGAVTEALATLAENGILDRVNT